jgi:hypothetical protein
MLELATAAIFFSGLALLTVARGLRARTVPAKALSMKATLERRVREGVEFTL